MQNKSWNKKINLDNSKIISNKDKTFIIAEVGSNHDQSLKKALKYISVASDIGADAVKFQFLDYEEMYKDHKNFSNEKKLFRKIKFNKNWISILKKECKKKKIIFFLSVTSLKSLKIIKKKKINLIKVASPQFYGNIWFTKFVLDSGIPTIISTGLSSEEEILSNIKLLKKSKNKKLVLLYCVSQYPLKYNNLDLEQIVKFKKKFKCLVGFSDHTRSIVIPSLAVEKGASVIEKHITLNRNGKGPDHFFSLEPNEFKKMIEYIRDIDSYKMSKKKKFIDKKLLQLFRIKCIAPKNFKKNERLTNIKLNGLRSVSGIPIDKADFIEKNFVAKKNLKKGDIIRYTNLKKIHAK